MLAYLLKMTLCWTALLGVYQLGWKQGRSFLANRLYLLGALVMGLALPLMQWDSTILEVTRIPWGTVDALTVATTATPTTAVWHWQDLVGLLYGAGVLLALFVLLYQLSQLRTWYQQGTKTHYDQYTLVELPSAVPPFSFGHCLFIGAGLRQNAATWALVQRHELAHIQQRHTWDVMALALLRAVFWFHPILWLYQQALRDQHEYAADAAVLQHSSVAQYGRLLLDQSIQYNPNALAHLFFHSPLKKRILMMTNKAQGQRPLIKYAMSLLTVALLSWQVSAQSDQLVKEVDTQPYPLVQSCTNDDAVAQCSNKELLQFIYANTKYPKEAKDQKKEGMVVVSFVVKRNGKMGDATVVKKAHPALDAEALRVVRLAQKEFQWAPAIKDNKKVSAVMNLPLKFKLQ